MIYLVPSWPTALSPVIYLFRTLYTFELFIDYRFQQDAQVSFVVKAVSALTAAFRLVQLDHCSQSVLASCLRQVHSDLHEDILTNLRKLSFTSMGTSPTEVKGTQHHFTRNGRLVANKQLVFQINQAVGMESVSTIPIHICIFTSSLNFFFLCSCTVFNFGSN